MFRSAVPSPEMALREQVQQQLLDYRSKSCATGTRDGGTDKAASISPCRSLIPRSYHYTIDAIQMPTSLDAPSIPR